MAAAVAGGKKRLPPAVAAAVVGVPPLLLALSGVLLQQAPMGRRQDGVLIRVPVLLMQGVQKRRLASDRRFQPPVGNRANPKRMSAACQHVSIKFKRVPS